MMGYKIWMLIAQGRLLHHVNNKGDAEVLKYEVSKKN